MYINTLTIHPIVIKIVSTNITVSVTYPLLRASMCSEISLTKKHACTQLLFRNFAFNFNLCT